MLSRWTRDLNFWRVAFQKTPVLRHTADQGCQMVYFQTKNPNLGKFWRVSEWKSWYI
jgi:hypothetical protein